MLSQITRVRRPIASAIVRRPRNVQYVRRFTSLRPARGNSQHRKPEHFNRLTVANMSTGTKIINELDEDEDEEVIEKKAKIDKHKVDVYGYHRSGFNTILNVCPQGYKMVIETLGKFSRVQESGLFLAVPFLQKIAYVLDDRELVVDVHKQMAHTGDNVETAIAAQIYLTITDTQKACYNVKRPLVAVVAHAQSAMRSSVGRYDLDTLLKDRVSISVDVLQALETSEKTWGIKVHRVEITDLTPGKEVAAAMNLQATAERERRQTEKNAEAEKRAMELVAEGFRIKLIEEAEGRAEALRIESEAQANVVETLGAVGISSADVLKFQTTLRYIDSMTLLAAGGKHSTFFMGKDLSDAGTMTKNILDVFQKKE